MWTLAVFAVAVAAALIEASAATYPNSAEWRREARISVILGAAAILVELAVPDHPGLRAGVAWSAALGVAVFLSDDFLYYWSHRLAHKVSFFWASHAVHHSPSRYNFLTGLRQPPTWILTPAAIAPVLLLLCGAPPALVAISAAIRGIHHFIIHTDRVRALPGWIERVFNTPSHHRVHHAVEAACLDRNFGGVLIVWDRLFGTFVSEADAQPARYGLVCPTHPSAWRTVLDPWIDIFWRARQATGLGARLRVLLAPPRARTRDRSNGSATA
jgi:sterol desaturase/sphingolipid hydroxylase (fatty acid hydroxylase superfamily)